jgi:hypothetical protein
MGKIQVMRHRSWFYLAIVLACQPFLANCQPEGGNTSGRSAPPDSAQVSSSLPDTTNSTHKGDSPAVSGGGDGVLTSLGKPKTDTNPFATITNPTVQFGSVKDSGSKYNPAAGISPGSGTLPEAGAAADNPYARTIKPDAAFTDLDNTGSRTIPDYGLNTGPGKPAGAPGVSVGTSRIPVTTTGVTRK